MRNIIFIGGILLILFGAGGLLFKKQIVNFVNGTSDSTPSDSISTDQKVETIDPKESEFLQDATPVNPTEQINLGQPGGSKTNPLQVTKNPSKSGSSNSRRSSPRNEFNDKFRYDDNAYFSISEQRVITKPQVFSSREADELPSFPGGKAALNKFIDEIKALTPAAITEGIGGRIVVEFVVYPDGTLNQYQVVETADAGLGVEAVRVFKKMPNWNPGKIANRTVPIRTSITVAFDNVKPQAAKDSKYF